MRIFTGLDLPEGVIGSLQSSISALRPAAPLIGWTQAEDLHITTKFVGEWPAARLDEVKSVLAEVPRKGPIPIRIEGVGWFPNPNSPRVFWAAVHAPESLQALAADTDRATAKLGVEPESREFRPHLTLARIKQVSNPAPLRQAAAGLGSLNFGSLVAQSFFLYLSEPSATSKGSKYTKLAEFPLT